MTIVVRRAVKGDGHAVYEIAMSASVREASTRSELFTYEEHGLY